MSTWKNLLQRCICNATLPRSCHLTRDTGKLLGRCGYDTTGLEAFEVEGLGILAPHIAGVLQV